MFLVTLTIQDGFWRYPLFMLEDHLLDSSSSADLGLWFLFHKFYEAMNLKVQVHQVQQMPLEGYALLIHL